MTTTEVPTIGADEAAAELARLAGHPAVLNGPPVQLTRSAANIDAAVALVSQPDGNLEDVAMLLRRVATADLDAVSTIDPTARLQGLCAFIAQRLRDQYSDDIRCAPPAALSEFVRDGMVECQAPTCGVMRAPWESNVCDDPQCVREVRDAFGDVS